MSATTDLLDFAAARHVLPRSARADAMRLLADTLAVGAAGRGAPGEAAILAAAARFGGGGEARLLGEKTRLPAPSAAFVNGYRIHCLEWDAVHEGAVVHALSVVTAALCAVVDTRGGCDPEDALVALAVGVDVASGLGIAADSALTFFRPATAGLIGAALAVARIEGIASDRFADVLGIAYSSCAGTMQAHVEGTVALPFQIANAARAAVVAVDLVQARFTGPHDALEGPFGYFTLFDRGDLSRYTRSLGTTWRVSEVSTKPFPSGRASHGVLGALQLLRSPPDRSGGGQIDRVEAHVPPLVHRLVGRPAHADMTPAHARLCLPFLVALMLTDGTIDPRRFVAEAFADPDLLALAERVVVEIDDNPDPNALSPQRIVVTLSDGSRIEHMIDATLGSPAAPLSPEQSTAKLALARDVAGPIADARLFDDPLGYFTEPA